MLKMLGEQQNAVKKTGTLTKIAEASEAKATTAPLWCLRKDVCVCVCVCVCVEGGDGGGGVLGRVEGVCVCVCLCVCGARRGRC